MSERALGEHLQPQEISAFVDGVLPENARAAVHAHLAECADCRAEVVDVGRIVQTLPSGRRSGMWIPAVAAAAVILVLVGPRMLRDPAPIHRDEPVGQATIAPRPILPLGTVDSMPALLWGSVAGADRYRVRLFDSTGTMLWERESVDTMASVPDSVSLRAAVPYYWKVEAHTGFDRWEPSDLVEFVVRSRRP